MRKTFQFILTLFIALASLTESMGQITVYNSANLTLSSGVTVTVNANLVNQTNGSPGTFQNDGILDLKYDLTNNAANNLFTTTTTGLVQFTNTGDQTIGGTNPITAYDLQVNKPSNNLILSVNNNKITNILTLTEGKIILGSNTLVLDIAGTVSGANASSYVEADGSGVFQKNFTSIGSFSFPVGDTDDYTPFGVTMNSASFGGSDFISCRVTSTPHPEIIPPDYIDRYWTLNAGGFTAMNYDAIFTYTDDDIEGSEDYVYASVYDGSNWTQYSVANTATNSLVTAGISGMPSNKAFSGGGFSLLSNHSLEFKANRVKDYTELEWESASEGDNQYYTVERSSNGVDFVELSKLNSTGNQGMPSSYSYHDHSAISGSVYYRLKQTDINGKTSYSKIILLAIKALTSPLSAFFNTGNHSVEVKKKELSAATVNLFIHSSTGQELFNKSYEVKNNEFAQAVSGLNFAKGIYYITLVAGTEKFTKKIVIAGN